MASWYEISNTYAVPSPAMLIDPNRVRHNLEVMISWAGPDRLRPHVKTHKLPHIVRLKKELGITKFKTATIAETEMTAQAGGKDILLAYPLVGPTITRFLQLQQSFSDVRFSTIVDDLKTAEEIQHVASRQGAAVRLMLDLNVGMNRTGVLIGERAFRIYEYLHQASCLIPAGLHAYDGHLHGADIRSLEAAANQIFESVFLFQSQLLAAGFDVPSVVGCGTGTSALMATQKELEVSAGTTVLWDAGQQATSPDSSLQHAAILLTRVISKPAASLLCLDLGHKAIASEMQPPRAVFPAIPDAKHVFHSEEHLVIETRAAQTFSVGDVVYAIPWHICPTMALHNEVWCIQNGAAKETWPVVARDRRITF